MLRTAAIASLGLRRLVTASATVAAPESRTSLLLRFISGPVTIPEPAVRRLPPIFELTRGYARGRQSSFSDAESDDKDDFDEEIDDEFADNDEFEMDEDLDDENSWDEPDEADDF